MRYKRFFNRFYDLICLQNINNCHYSDRMSFRAANKTFQPLWAIRFGVTICLFQVGLITAQDDHLSFWEAPDTLHRGRSTTALVTGITVYTGAVISLNRVWYEDYPRTSFHFFNDWAEWQQMDKAGHMFTAYFESDWCYHIARWTGMKRSSAIWTGAAVATGLQTTLEVLDGFSSGWGFSWYDMAFNVAGSGLWAFQQASWDQQKIRLKMSTTYPDYPTTVIYGSPEGAITLEDRADDLFGKRFYETFLKDYNAQTIWASFNIHSFLKKESRFPKWLNIAAGYGAANMYGGFENKWVTDGNTYVIPEADYPRYRQWYLSPDIDLSRIKTKSKFVNTLLCMVNIFKFPAPALEINGNGVVKWKWIHY